MIQARMDGCRESHGGVGAGMIPGWTMADIHIFIIC